MEALDAIERIGSGFGQGQVTTPVNTLALECAKEALGRRIVAAAPDSSHAADDVMIGQKLLELDTGELGAAIQAVWIEGDGGVPFVAGSGL